VLCCCLLSVLTPRYIYTASSHIVLYKSLSAQQRRLFGVWTSAARSHQDSSSWRGPFIRRCFGGEGGGRSYLMAAVCIPENVSSAILKRRKRKKKKKNHLPAPFKLPFRRLDEHILLVGLAPTTLGERGVWRSFVECLRRTRKDEIYI
jgi:hypothetical protein